MTTTNINLELGDIIKLHAPTNEALNEKTFIISFINDSIIDLNSAELEISLTLEDGKLTDESITKITILFKNELKGFAKQNNLVRGIWVDIEFGGDVPLIITSHITDVVEDMIELKTYPDGNVIYIDFAYNGLPKELNIKRITVRDEPIKEKKSEESVTKQAVEQIEEEIGEDSFAFDIPELTPEQVPEVKIQEEIIEGSKIVFGESMGELIQIIDVEDQIKRFDLETQVNDLLDEMLSKIPKQNRTYKVINEIHTYIERFKQLREEFSEFDSVGNVVEKVLKGVHHKPLAGKLKDLNTRIPWILPVVLNKKKIYDIEEDNQFVVPIKLNENILELNEILKQTESLEEQTTLFKSILRNSKPYYTPFEQYISDLSITNKQTNTFIQTIANAENFNFFAVNDEDVKSVKFHLTPYVTNDTLNVIGFIILPETFITDSMKFLPGLNIAKKSILNKKNILLSKYLSSKSKVNQIEISDDTQKEYKNFYNGLKYLISTAEDKNYDKFVENMIPKIRDLVKIVSENIKKTEYIVSYNNFLTKMEPFYVYYDDLTFKNFTDINEIIFQETNKYKIDFINKQKQFEIYKNIRNTEFRKYKLYYDRVIGLLETYNIRNRKLSKEEFIKLCLEKDSGKFLYSNISNINFKNYVGLNLDPVVLQEKLVSLKTSEDNTKTCDSNVIAKKYTSLSELELDNGKNVYFDKDRDPTRYDIYESLTLDDTLYDQADLEGEFYSLKNTLMERIGLSEKNAERDASAMIDGKRIVEEGDLCILEIDGKITYYNRTNNYWVLDNTIDESYFKDKTKLLCNTNELCISSNLDCETVENKKNQHNKDNLDKVITSIEIEQQKKSENIKEQLLKNYNHTKQSLIFNIRERPHNIKSKINDEFVSQEQVVSPHLNLLNAILSQTDFPKKQNDIIRFKSLYTVEGETKYIRNCIDTNTKLFPTFLSLLASAFNAGVYSDVLDDVCKTQGVISDDGDKWVDKHSGMFIKNIEFSTEEGYDDSGFKVVSRDILDNDIDLKVIMDEDQSKFKGDKGLIHNVIMSITNFIGITLKEEDIDNTIEIITQIVKAKVPEKSVYDKKREIMLKKTGKKLPPYETTYYNILLLTSISLLFIHIQTTVPSVIPKKSFPGCVRSFSGYPIGDESELSGIKYISCIAHKMKTDSIPWNTIRKVKEETLAKQLQVFIKSIVDNAYITKRITSKIEYLVSNPESKETLEKTIEWKTFLPDLNLTYSDSFVPLTKTFFEQFNKNFKGENYYYIFLILSKIYYLSLYNQKSINTSVKSMKPSILTNIGVPYLENSCDLTKYNEIHNWYDIKHNDIACAYREYYDFTKKNSKPNIRINNLNTKLEYEKIPNLFSENVIYNTFIFYCLKQKTIDAELNRICKVDPATFDARTEEELKRTGVNYNEEDFDLLLKHIFSKNIIRNEIRVSLPITEIENPNLSQFNDLYIPLLDISKQEYSKNRKQTDLLRNYVLEYIDVIKTSLLSLYSSDLSYSKSQLNEVETFFESLGEWNRVEGTLTISSDDLTANTSITFLQNTIDKLGKLFPYAVINSVNYSNIKIRKNLNLSDRHISDIQTFVYSEFQPLETFYEDGELNTILEKIVKETSTIINYLKNGPNLLVNLEDIQTIVLGKTTMIEVYQFFVCLIINVYITEAYITEDYDIKKRLGDFIFNLLQMVSKNKKTLNMTQEEMYSKLLKYKETEKSEITTYLRDISDELREIENVMKNNKLGKWSKGQTKGLVTYTADTYDGEAMKQDLRDQDNLEFSQEEQMANDISDEVDNLGFLADDDDFGERDGDEGF